MPNINQLYTPTCKAGDKYLLKLNPLCMTTFTKRTTSLMVHGKDLDNSLATLNNEGLLLFPTDTIWSIGCDATDEIATRRLLRLKPNDQPLEIIVDSVEMLREYVLHLHPRIETLLCYHARPLSIVFKEVKNLADVLINHPYPIAFRLCQDDYCRQLISAFGKPVLTTAATLTSDKIPASFGSICSDVFSVVDYISKFRQETNNMEGPAVMVAFDYNGELSFLRE